MGSSSDQDIVGRIRCALEAASEIFTRYTPGKIAAEYKSGHDPVTAADREIDALLAKKLLREGEGWLSEESVDDDRRLPCARVWVVDPLDGTREFVAGIPEFSVSIALVEQGLPVAGGILNPATGETFLGSVGSGVTYNGSPASASRRTRLEGALVLASRSEVARGEWQRFQNAPFKIQAMGSVAYKLARVAAGLADVTFTLTPKHEWDVAAGAALLLSAGGFVESLEGPLAWNQKRPKISGLIAGGPLLRDELSGFLRPHMSVVGK
ncbi:MAG: 3'(2'),5'-bisphosphate nucleotidase CysQ [Acidobacteria bacterium]|nr:3'(2'),5'-bisphosphate nucleotidase CysQ [Acidobacteriota bacterium]